MPPTREELDTLIRIHGALLRSSGSQSHFDPQDSHATQQRADGTYTRITAALDALYAELAELRAVFGDLCQDTPAARAIWNLAVESVIGVVREVAHERLVLPDGTLLAAVRALKKE